MLFFQSSLRLAATLLLAAAPVAGFLALSANPARAQNAAPVDPGAITADEIIEKVHLSRALRDKTVLQGQLEKDGKTVPFSISMESDLIAFRFANPDLILSLNINDKGSKLFESDGGKNREVPLPRYSEGIRGTDLTYDDISFRYLYWPKRVKQPIEETVKTKKCYVVDLYAPNKIGAYGVVRVFVEKESWALLKIFCYDWNGKQIKECAITSGMKVNGATTLKSMDVISYVPDTKKVAGETTFELRKP